MSAIDVIHSSRPGSAKGTSSKVGFIPVFEKQRQRFFWLLLAPVLAILGVVTLLPTLYLLITSFTPLNLANPATAWDFSDPLVNYRTLLTDDRLHNSLWVQAKLSVVTCVLQILFGLGIALLLNMRTPLMNALRTSFLVPMVLPPIVVAIIWKVLYSPDISPAWWLFQVPQPTFTIAGDEIEMGMGIHGEPGIWRNKLKPADEIVDEMLERLLADAPKNAGSEVSILVNGLGATPLEELFILYRRASQKLGEAGLRIVQPLVGNYVTSMEMAGASISLCFLDSELKTLLAAPAVCPFWRVG